MSKTQTAEQAESYYSKENYYQQNSEIGQWHGTKKMLSFLNIKDGQEIEKKAYSRILGGYHPETKKELVKGAGMENRRAGMDITFSAPKSVSVLAHFAKSARMPDLEKKLKNLHEVATQRAMKKLSEKYVKTRVRSNNDERVLKNAEIIWAGFQHDTSRATNDGNIDPQIHTHNFLMSMVLAENADGKLQTYAMTNEEIYQNKMYLGQFYRSEFANLLKEEGFEIEVTDIRQGFFDIKGFSPKQLETFSGRAIELRKKLEESGIEGVNKAKLLNSINANSKNRKEKINRDELIIDNWERMMEVGINHKLIKKIENQRLYNIEKKIPLSEEKTAALTKVHLKKAISILEANESVFKFEDIIKNALKLGLEYSFVQDDYIPQFIELMEENHLIQLDKNAYSTKRIVESEKGVIKAVLEGQNTMPQYVTNKVNIDNYIDAIDLKNAENGKLEIKVKRGQREMVKSVLTAKDQFIAIMGDAGTGKTFSAKIIADYMKENNPKTEIIGLSFTGKAAQGLEADSGIFSKTLHSFIYQEQNRKDADQRKRLLVIDETGMAGSLQIKQIVDIAKANGDKVVFIGDTKQFSSISAGNIFADMEKYGIHTTYMDEVMRQKSEHAIEIVSAIKQRKTNVAIAKLEQENALFELSKEEIIEEVSDKFSEKYPSILESEKPLKKELIVVSKNADRNQINEQIRSKIGLASSGQLFTVKEAYSDHTVAKFYTHDLEIGMIVKPNNVPHTRNGSLYKLVEIKDDKKIVIEAENGSRVTIDYHNETDKLQIWKEKEKKFAIEETIIFTKNFKDKDSKFEFKNGERAIIASIEGSLITTTDGKIVDLKENNFIDYGYAITDVKSQGATTENVTIVADSQLANIHAFYTQATRSEYKISLYTNNKEELIAKLEKEVERTSTLSHTMKECIRNKKKFTREVKMPIKEEAQKYLQRIKDKGLIKSSPKMEKLSKIKKPLAPIPVKKILEIKKKSAFKKKKIEEIETKAKNILERLEEVVKIMKEKIKMIKIKNARQKEESKISKKTPIEIAKKIQDEKVKSRQKEEEKIKQEKSKFKNQGGVER